ncbi:hypothetical protein [Oceanisphaera sp. IT1-181]|uniref:hypothetical protein n=1 Tax=Oceanisphaera sp. IT1-181 TaxID=3081199 RepID=UPI0029CA1054|nr:hypothetical protein [Oceanisphaera sp. IT1-181]
MKKISGLLALISSVGLVQASEIPAPFNNHDIGVLLADDVLGAQRGKFVAGPKAHYFGIEFITSVVGPNGSIMTSGMQLNVNFNRNNPAISMSGYGNDVSLTSDSHQGNAGTNNQLPNGSGLVQVAQIAGNANTGINDLMFVPGQMQTKGSSLNQGHYQLNLPDGMVRYDFNNGSLGMTYSSKDGNLSSTQMLRGSNGNQGFVQQLSIADNNKLISNQTKFYMGDQLGSYADLAETLRQQLPMGAR